MIETAKHRIQQLCSDRIRVRVLFTLCVSLRLKPQKNLAKAKSIKCNVDSHKN